MPHEIAARELPERGVTVHGLRVRQPIPHEHVRLLLPRHGPAHHEAPQRRLEQQVVQRLPLGTDTRGGDALPERVRGERSLAGERALDRLDPALDVPRRNTLLGQPALAARPKRRRGDRLNDRIVLAADQVERAAVEPCDDERPVLGERTVDIGRGDAARAGAHGEPKPNRILPLYGEDPLREPPRDRARAFRTTTEH